MRRRYSFALVLVAVGIGMVSGALVGSRAVSAPTLLAATGSSPFAVAAPPAGASVRAPDFADIIEGAVPAVVTVRNTSVRKVTGEGEPFMFRDDPFFHFFFGPREPNDRRRSPRTEKQLSSGSGFIVSPDGYVMTNHHVVEGASRIVVTLNDGDKYEGKVIGADPMLDLALLKIAPGDKRLPTIPLGDSENLRVGEWVIAIGNPVELQNTVTVGVVSGKGRRVPIGGTDQGVARFIQTDAAINFGNSGGPLLDAQGRVIGISTAILRGDMMSPLVEGIGFALPINDARRAAEQLRTMGSVQRGYLGIVMNQTGVTEKVRKYYKLPDSGGVLVADVPDGEPAQKAGVKAGDIIRKVDGEPAKDNEDLLDRIASKRPGDPVRLEVFREGRTFEVTVTLGDRARLADRGRRAEESPEEEGDVEEGPAKALGISVEPLTDRARTQMRYDDAVRGVIVSDVEVGSEAEDEGIRNGMVVAAMDDKPIRDLPEWNAEVRHLREGEIVKLDLVVPENDHRYVFLRVPPETAETKD